MSPLALNPAAATIGSHCAAALLQPSVLPFCDAIIAVAGSTYPAHRAVLAIHSAVLARQLLFDQLIPPQAQSEAQPINPSHQPQQSPSHSSPSRSTSATISTVNPTLPSANDHSPANPVAQQENSHRLDIVPIFQADVLHPQSLQHSCQPQAGQTQHLSDDSTSSRQASHMTIFENLLHEKDSQKFQTGEGSLLQLPAHEAVPASSAAPLAQVEQQQSMYPSFDNAHNNREAAMDREIVSLGTTSEPTPSIVGSSSWGQIPRFGVSVPLSNPVSLELVVPGVPEQRIRAGWQLVYDYLYEVYLPDVDVAVAAAALEICDHWEFDELGATLLEFVLNEITPMNCVELYVIASRDLAHQHQHNSGHRQHSSSHHHQPGQAGHSGHRLGPRVSAIREACSLVMKERFDEVEKWGKLDVRSLARLLKLNDLHVEGNEQAVFWTVASWIRSQELELSRITFRAAEGPDGASSAASPLPDVFLAGADVEALIRLIRFPTIPKHVVGTFYDSPIVSRYPLIEKYMAQAGRSPRRHITIETSPLFRPRSIGVLTFSDRISSFSRVTTRIQTSARYFAGCLWHLVVGKRDGFVELYLGALSEESGAALLVQLDVTLYVAQVVPGTPIDTLPRMTRRELKGVTFAHSGQKTGFPKMIPVEELTEYAPNNALSVGATLRLRGCREQVDTIDNLVDHTAISVTM